MTVLSGRVPPARLYPAGETGVRAHQLVLSSGLRVRAVEAGPADGQAVILVPGWGCSAWIFHETLLPLAAAELRAIAVELKGHGLSDKPRSTREYTVEAMRDHVIEIVDALRLDRAGLVGHSMGGPIVAQVAAAVPERVLGVAMVAPVGFSGVPAMWLLRLLTPEFMNPLLPRLASRTMIRAILAVVYGSIRSPSERTVEEFWAPTQFAEFALAMRHLLHEFRWNEELPPLAVPWITLLGRRDRLSPASDAARYSGDGSKGTIVIDGAGHVMFDEAPGIVNAALTRFFSQLSGATILSPR